MKRSPAVLLFLLILTGLGLPAQEAAETTLKKLQQRLLTEFDASIQDMRLYEQRVTSECAVFPEANLFPYVLPALAYGNLAYKDPSYAPTAADAMARLIDPAIRAFESKTQSPLLSLKSYMHCATELGQINLALAVYQSIGGKDAKLLQTHQHLNQLLKDALRESQGSPLFSYPSLTWPFDTMPCVVSLLLSDPTDKDAQALARAHLNWIKKEGIHLPTQLPYGEMGREFPRGCDLSLRLPLLQHFAPELADSYYQRYTQQHWAVMGFREWPVGYDAGIDIDSGPIFNGIGLSATGNGIAAVLAFNDLQRTNVLIGLLNQRDLWVSLYNTNTTLRQTVATQFENSFVPIDTQYFTGFLYGDAALFYMLTWECYNIPFVE